MDSRQLSILNAMVTYVAENVPGGLTKDEQEVARIVGRWVLQGGREGRTHDYILVNSSHYTDALAAINIWAEKGWRLVTIIPSKGAGYAHQVILERPVGVTHPDD